MKKKDKMEKKEKKDIFKLKLNMLNKGLVFIVVVFLAFNILSILFGLAFKVMLISTG